MNKFLQVHQDDNVLVALLDLQKGTEIVHQGQRLTLDTVVPQKHKFTINSMSKGEKVIMYGTVVGTSKEYITSGSVISRENIEHLAEEYKEFIGNYKWNAPSTAAIKKLTFDGFHRADGKVGTANYWIFIPLVFCQNRNLEVIKNALYKSLGYNQQDKYIKFTELLINKHKSGASAEELSNINFHEETLTNQNRVFENIDGIKFLSHISGCGSSHQDSESLCALLAGYIDNPNVAGATVLSLGCQQAQISILQEKLNDINFDLQKPLLFFEQQQSESEEKMIESAIKDTFINLIEVNKQTRKPASIDKLVVGLECGGSDGFSGISANPTLGYVSDLLVKLGASTILSEFPELCGIEQELINRCTSKRIAEKFIYLQRTYENNLNKIGSSFDMNPSPGNIKDGLITDAMKSAGAAKKGGTAPIIDILDYTEQITQAGLNLLCTPGNDVESTTAMAGSGANLILFTTGLGTPTGNPISPVIKVASNSSVANRLSDIIDIDTGSIISGKKTIPEMALETILFMIEVASGRIKTKATLLGQDDFIPWKRGVSL